MPEGPVSVELWNGKEAIGHLQLYSLEGSHAYIYLGPGVLKEEYGKKYGRIKLPFITRVVSMDRVDTLTRRVLDVRRKSKRQIKLLLSLPHYLGGGIF